MMLLYYLRISPCLRGSKIQYENCISHLLFSPGSTCPVIFLALAYAAPPSPSGVVFLSCEMCFPNLWVREKLFEDSDVRIYPLQK